MRKEKNAQKCLIILKSGSHYQKMKIENIGNTR